MFSPIGVKQLIEYFQKNEMTFKNIVAYFRVFATLDITHTFDCSLRDFNSKRDEEKKKWIKTYEEKYNSLKSIYMDLFQEVFIQLKKELQFDHYRTQSLDIKDTRLVSKLMNFIREMKIKKMHDINSLDLNFKFVYLEHDNSGNMRCFQCYSHMFNYMNQIGMIRSHKEKMNDLLNNVLNPRKSKSWADEIEYEDSGISFLDVIIKEFEPLSQAHIDSLFNNSKAIDRYATKSPIKRLIDKNHKLYEDRKEILCVS